MAKVYLTYSDGTADIVKARKITIPAPYDVRSVVETYDDLYDNTVYTRSELYLGMLVVTLDTNDVYVLTAIPGKKQTSATAWAANIGWKKIGDVTVDPADNLAYYEDKLGAKVVDSFDELLSSSIDSFVGMLGIVKGGESESEDESGLYVLTRTPNTTASNWYRVLGGSGSGNASSGLDVSEVITSDGSAPAAGTGFSLDSNDPDALVEEIYVDDYLHAGVYYTSHGINSSKANGGDELDGVNKIKFTNGGSSYIELTADGSMKIYLADNSLGFTKDDISLISANGTVYDHPYVNQSLPLTIPSIPLADGAMIKFDVDVNFTGMTETRDDDPTTYEFGDDGCGYEDIDFYSVNVLPTVYAYAEGEKVRVLTEGDKDELINKIDESFEPITTAEIQGLF